MKKGWIIGAVIALLALIAILINFSASKAQAEEDKASLKAQKAAAGGMAGGPPGIGDMAKELNLTPLQQKQMQEAQADMFKQMAALNKGGNPQDAMKHMPELMKAQQERMAKILTPEQQKKMQEAMQSRMGAGFPGGGPPGGFPGGNGPGAGFPGGGLPGAGFPGAGNSPTGQGGK